MTAKLSPATINFARARQRLIKAIEATLKKDKRVVAAWLTGSYASGREDAFSDVDLSVVVAQANSESLCSSGLPIAKEQKELFSTYGEIANAHQNQQNAPKGGVMVTVLYGNGITVDWVLIPEKFASRPNLSLVLFENRSIPMESSVAAQSDDSIVVLLEQRISYFWMMASVAAKSILRGEDLRFHVFYEILLHTVHEIESLHSGERPSFIKFVTEDLLITAKDQTRTLLSICKRLRKISGSRPQSVLETIRLLLQLANS